MPSGSARARAVMPPCLPWSPTSRRDLGQDDDQWQKISGGTGPLTPPKSAAAWNTDQMPGLPELDIARVRRWCEQRVPEHARGQVRVECDIAHGT
jgi:hypothetical protein